MLPVAWIALCFGWFGAGWVLDHAVLPADRADALPHRRVGAGAHRGTAVGRLAGRDGAGPALAARRRRNRDRPGGGVRPTPGRSPSARIYTRPHSRIAASRWLYANLPWKLTLHVESDDGTATMQPLGLPTVAQPQSSAAAPELPVTVAGPQAPVTAPVFAPRATACSAASRWRLRALDGGASPRLAFSVAAVYGSGDARADCEVTGAGADCRLASALPLTAGHDYDVRLQSDRPARIAGAAFATEGSWD